MQFAIHESLDLRRSGTDDFRGAMTNKVRGLENGGKEMRGVDLGLDLAALPPPQSPRVLGAINPNSIRAHSSAKRSTGKWKTPRSSGRKMRTTPGGSKMFYVDSNKSNEGSPSAVDLSDATASAHTAASPKFPRNLCFDEERENKRVLKQAPKSQSRHRLQELGQSNEIERGTQRKFSCAEKKVMGKSVVGKVKADENSVSPEGRLSISQKPKEQWYKSPSDMLMSPVSTSMTFQGVRVDARKAIAKRAILAKKKNTAPSQVSSSSDEGSSVVTTIIPTRSNRSVLPSLPSAKQRFAKLNQLEKLRSPTDSICSPVSSAFYEKRAQGGKLQKVNVRKSIFQKNNRK